MKQGENILILNNRHFSSNFLSLIQCDHISKISEPRDALQRTEIR